MNISCGAQRMYNLRRPIQRSLPPEVPPSDDSLPLNLRLDSSLLVYRFFDFLTTIGLSGFRADQTLSFPRPRPDSYPAKPYFWAYMSGFFFKLSGIEAKNRPICPDFCSGVSSNFPGSSHPPRLCKVGQKFNFQIECTLYQLYLKLQALQINAESIRSDSMFNKMNELRHLYSSTSE